MYSTVSSFISLLYVVFKEFCSSVNGILYFNDLTCACQKIGIQLSLSQVMQIRIGFLHVYSRDGIYFHEFCVLVTLVKSSKERRKKFCLHNTIFLKSLSGKQFDKSVFLGGACNPTTWRTDIAIPFLQENQIKYYNPQVNEWSPDLIQLENSAKEQADILLFVLDPCTRGVVSILEIAFLAGLGRNMVLVMPDITRFKLHQLQSNQEDVDLLWKCYVFLLDMVERRGLPVFRDLQKALRAVQVLIQNPHLTVRDLTNADGAEPFREGLFNIGEHMRKLETVFRKFDTRNCGYLSLKEVCLAFCSDRLQIHQRPINLLNKRTKAAPPATYNFTDFCILYAEELAAQCGWLGELSHWWHIFCHLPRMFWRWLHLQLFFKKKPARYDIYLGGSGISSNKRCWRTRLAEPLLQKNGVTFYNPQTVQRKSIHLSVDTVGCEHCSILLYIINADMWASCWLAEAAHSIGLGRRVVLYVEAINSFHIGMSSSAVKDFNRGRQYLLDLAIQAGVPILDTPRLAVIRAIQISKQEYNFNE